MVKYYYKDYNYDEFEFNDANNDNSYESIFLTNLPMTEGFKIKAIVYTYDKIKYYNNYNYRRLFLDYEI